MDRQVSQQPYDDEAETNFGFDDVLRILRRHWRMVLAVAATFTAIAAQIMIMVPNTYLASATVQVEQRRKQIVQMDQVLEDIRPNTPTVETEVEILRSSSLALKVIEKLNLRSDPEFASPEAPNQKKDPAKNETPAAASRNTTLADTADKLLNGPRMPQPTDAATDPIAGPVNDSVGDYIRRQSGADQTEVRDAVLMGFLARLDANRIRNSLLIEVTFRSQDPNKAARIVNTVVDTYLSEQIGQKTGASDLASELLGARINKLRRKLADSERKLEAFKAKHEMFDADGHNVLERQLARETEALVQASSQAAEARARYDQARRIMLTGGNGDSLGNVLKNTTVRVFREELAKALRRRAELRTKYGPRHPAIQKSAADIAKARSELSQQINSLIQNLKAELEVAEDRKRQLAANLADLKSRISATKSKGWQLDELKREVTTSRTLYEALLSRRKQMTEIADLQFPDSRIVQRATVPLVKDGPKRKQMVMLAGLAGLVLGFAAAFLFEVLRPGFDAALETERELLLEQIAAVPEVPGATAQDRLKLARMVVADPSSLYAEAIRGLTHAITSRADGPTVILITSALSGEGRSTLSSNIALQLAVSGRNTLLVDGDLRAGGLTRTLGIQDTPGLSEILSGACAPSAALLHDATTGLHVLPANPARPSPDTPTPPASQHLLSSPQARGLFTSLRRHFDVVVIDAPALLPVVDGRILAQFADVALLTFRWRATGKAQIKQALRALGPNQDRLMGAIMNRMDPQEYATTIGAMHRRQYEQAA